MGRILCVGALTMDTIFRLDRLPEGPGKVIPLDAVEVAEGMAAAQAASIVRLGGEAALWASAGDDATGDRLVKQISGEGVDCSRVRRVAGSRSGFSSIFMDRTGSTMIVPRYDPTLMAPPEAAPGLGNIDAVMTDVRWPGAAALALAAAKAAGIPAILDADMAAREVLDGLLPLATHVVASESAAKLVTGADTPDVAAGRLATSHGGFVAVTAGADGCWWTEGGGIRHSPAPKVEAIDTLAAGDVFHAGFAVGLLEGWPMRNVIAFASAAAAIKCTRFGGRLGAPSRAEVEAFLVR
ncbi:PfkB family carbohydrate kinase [Devosia sp. ZB163]|uniref:PfkB family carbohydrate kinase n=1 Tax=Devosia sp. ZB163 TaxID=3025938 RepID=UPI002361027E|nr:PfkB family carbohydrate kinase [Devosia sp. ZB163]MDC9826451.1 PfkB family carbohydrate kinase [Devosia sp. ZB163]